MDMMFERGFSFMTWDELMSEYRDLVTKGIISDFDIYHEDIERRRTYYLKYKLPPTSNNKWIVMKIISWEI